MVTTQGMSKEWSLIRGWGGGGGATELEAGVGVGASEVLPYEKRAGGRKSFSNVKGGGGGGLGVDFTQELEVLAILKGGGHNKFPAFITGGAQIILQYLERGRHAIFAF